MRRTILLTITFGILALGPGTPPLQAQYGYGDGVYRSPVWPPHVPPTGTPFGGYAPPPGGFGVVPPPPYLPGYGRSIHHRGYVDPGPSPVVVLADRLAAQADEFLQAFIHDADRVPQGGRFLADATAVRDAALRLRDLAATGAGPAVLAGQFGAVAAAWGRLETRMAVVSRGRIGPNIATALQMGHTVGEIGRILGY